MGFRKNKEDVYVLVDGKVVLQSELLNNNNSIETNFAENEQETQNEVKCLDMTNTSKAIDEEYKPETLLVIDLTEIQQKEVVEVCQTIEISEPIEKPVKKRGRPPGLSNKKESK